MHIATSCAIFGIHKLSSQNCYFVLIFFFVFFALFIYLDAFAGEFVWSIRNLRFFLKDVQVWCIY